MVIQLMSLRGQSGARGRVYFYVYLQNLPAKYVESDIFPQVLLREEVKEGLLEYEMHPKEAECLFGFHSKILSCLFEKDMVRYMPPFVLISRRKVEIPRELRQEKEYYDNRTLNTSIDEEPLQPNHNPNPKDHSAKEHSQPKEQSIKSQQTQSSNSSFSVFSKEWLGGGFISRALQPWWKRSNFRE